MTLHIYNCEQRSEEWYSLRRGMVTASAISGLLTPTLKVASNDTSRGIVASLTAERITGESEESFTNSDMLRGVLHEPFARAAYEQSTGSKVDEVGFMVRNISGYDLGCSPDGLIGDDGMLEIKSPRAKGHLQTILADAVPSFYMTQCQTALLVSGRKWLDYISFRAGMPLFVKRVHPDENWQAAIVAALVAFEVASAEMTDNYFRAVEGLAPTERVPDFFEEVV